MCSLYMAPGGSGIVPNRFLCKSRYIYRLGIKIVPRRNPSVPEPYTKKDDNINKSKLKLLYCYFYITEIPPGGSGFVPNRFLYESRYIYRLGIKIA